MYPESLPPPVDDATPPDPEAMREARLARLTHLFRKAGDGAATQALYRAVRDYRENPEEPA